MEAYLNTKHKVKPYHFTIDRIEIYKIVQSTQFLI